MDNAFLEGRITLYNRILLDLPGISIADPLKIEDKGITGIIRLQVDTSTLNFHTTIPLGYPLSSEKQSIRFCCEDIEGYLHQNLDGTICLHPDADDNVERKFRSEIELLGKWMKDYYINQKQDDAYGYLLINYSVNASMMFSDDSQIPPKGTYGKFEYFPFDKRPLNGQNELEQYIALTIGGHRIIWSNTLQKVNKFLIGAWFFIENEPITRNRCVMKQWSEMEHLFSSDALDYLYKSSKEIYDHNTMHSTDVDYFFIMLGYKIPSQSGYEAHWELIKVHFANLPTTAAKLSGKWKASGLKNMPIEWGRTVNGSYARFFGRGALCDKITSSKVLVVGVGALGSSLINHLVRGGCRTITIVDFDEVEVGNICRSTYRLNQIYDLKVWALCREMITISPYVDILPLTTIEKTIPGSPMFDEIRNSMNDFDYIFDCSTDMEISYMFDRMELNSKIINVSITNHATAMVCIVGGFNISEHKHQIFKKIDPNSQLPTFYPGTGCQYPTFEASFTDINALLGFTIKRINYMIENNRLSSFVVQFEEIQEMLNFKTYDF